MAHAYLPGILRHKNKCNLLVYTFFLFAETIL